MIFILVKYCVVISYTYIINFSRIYSIAVLLICLLQKKIIIKVYNLDFNNNYNINNFNYFFIKYNTHLIDKMFLRKKHNRKQIS